MAMSPEQMLAKNMKNLEAMKKALRDPKFSALSHVKIREAAAVLQVLVKHQQRDLLSSGKTSGAA